ncbi:MAG: response regulator transcription factor [Christensenellales bacterium]|jgi:DNA-binding response OmpR family regulator
MKRILIIEDDLNIAELEKDYLEVVGYEVLIVNDGKTGLKYALEKEYDLIILDLMLPECDGFDVCRKIREVKDTPILMVTAKLANIDKIRGLGIGADDYIVKPFDPSELVARVKAHISRYERIKGNASDVADKKIVIKDLTIEPLSRRVYVKDKEIMLTAKEYDLLLFFASNPNIVFSKEQIFDKVWGLDSLGDAGTVVVHLTHIREKTGLDYIETVRGAGYRFNSK